MGGKSSAVYSAAKGVAVTPDDSTVLETTRALWVGGTGDLSLVFADGGSAVTVASVPAGTLLPFQVTKVKAATTATSVVALY